MEKNQELERVIHAYLDAFNRGDVDAVVDAFTEDAVNHPPVGPAAVCGKRKLRQFFRQSFALNRPHISDYHPEYEVYGERAVVRERWTVTFHPEGKPPSAHPGQALWLAHRVDGDWKTHWLIGKLLPPASRPPEPE